MSAWRLLTADGVGAAEGLAFDEALMSDYGRSDPDCPPTLRLYTYRDHCVLVGRYQHLEAEVDLGACRLRGIDVNRRPTGGGAIIMGSGQLGVAVVTRAPAEQRPRELLERFSEGIMAGLGRVGVAARFRGKNDIEAGGRKIAGLGLYLDGTGGLLFHASILADLDIPTMLDVLRIPASKLGSRAVEAVEDRVTTVSRETGHAWDGTTLRSHVAAGMADVLGIGFDPQEPTAADVRLARRLVTDRYGHADWLRQYSPQPDSTATAVAKTGVGLVRVYIALHGQTIKSVLFTGDFNIVPEPFRALEQALKWKSLQRTVVERVAREQLEGYPELGDIEVVVDALGEAAARLAEPATASPDRNGSCYFPEVVGQS
ncbi:MAG: lipoate--protein ligase family protein [Acidimicrobiales bacterium]